MTVHPAAKTWALPPERDPIDPPLARTNLRALASRPGRFEHHLTVVARQGVGQIEVIAASEPLFFAHQNISDEYVLPLPTGDALVDAMPLRTFLTDPETNEDAARLRHRIGDLILHPYGWAHWPGRLRPPFEPPAFPPGMGRRSGLSMVFCASAPAAPADDRPAGVTEGREADAKPYRDDAPPLMIRELGREAPGRLGAVGDVTFELAAPPFAPPNGGWVVVVDSEAPEAFAGDLVRIPPGASWDPPIERALLMSSPSAAPEPPPNVWTDVAPAPFERTEAQPLPQTVGALEICGLSDAGAELRLGDRTAVVPRYWLARMLFRIALHTAVDDARRLERPRPCFGYVETYGGFFYDDRDGAFRLGLRGADATVEIAPDALVDTLARLYSAVAPEGHTEHLE